MKLTKLKSTSLQVKISSIYIVANLLVMLVNILLMLGINSMSNRFDMVYQDNLRLNEMAEALTAVQDDMTDYLSARTSDSLENYYRSEQAYSSMVSLLEEKITAASFDRMERSIKRMSEAYLDTASQAIEAKRGRNVEKYRIHYENATQLFNYLDTYIASLNMEQFKYNSAQYGELLRHFGTFEIIAMVVMSLVVISNVGIIIAFTGQMIRPLKRLAKSADEIARGNLDTELLEVESEDEVGVVTRAFNQMVISIRQYIERIRESMEAERALKEKELMMETHLKDARLKYLQAQINPHFLFNTLNAGAQLAMMEGADRTYEYVQKVAQFYRYNMRKGKETVSIGEEIEMVDSYIYILNVRFAGDIHYEKQLDETLLRVSMPGMILQPIVENCVNHGLREMAGVGKILLSVYRVGGEVCISVKDNGIGMQEETIAKIMGGNYQTDEKRTDSNGIGMDNVLSRMRLFTGSEDAICITSAGEGQGTEVILHLPIGKVVEGRTERGEADV